MHRPPARLLPDTGRLPAIRNMAHLRPARSLDRHPAGPVGLADQPREGDCAKPVAATCSGFAPMSRRAKAAGSNASRHGAMN
jgi:hypothetical protein